MGRIWLPGRSTHRCCAQGGRCRAQVGERLLKDILQRKHRCEGQPDPAHRQPDAPGKHEQAEPIELPAGAIALLMDILEAMAAGQGVTIIPENAELTTDQAADVLNVSHSFLIKLLDEQKIPHRKVGRYRRIRMVDVMAYNAGINGGRESVLDQLAVEAQEQDMGYGKP